MKRAEIQEKINKKKERLELYYAKEKEMLSKDGYQSYGLGTRSATRYTVDLSNLRAQIKELENEIKELEGKLNGRKPRKAYAVIPRDW